MSDNLKMRRRVQALLERGRHPFTNPNEASLCLEKAHKLIAQHGLRDLVAEPPLPIAAKAPPVVVHQMSGFSPSGATKVRAWCRCGHGTTPRSSDERAYAALVASHPLDVPVCVVCDLSGEGADWMAIRDRLFRVYQDPHTGDEFVACRDVLACRKRSAWA